MGVLGRAATVSMLGAQPKLAAAHRRRAVRAGRHAFTILRVAVHRPRAEVAACAIAIANRFARPIHIGAVAEIVAVKGFTAAGIGNDASPTKVTFP